MRADGWSRMPLVRMTNLHLEPGEGSLDDLLADVDDGVYLCRRTRAGRSTTSASTSSSARRSPGRSRAASSAGCCATRPTRASRPVFWGSLDARRRAGRVAAVRADELRQGPARPARARLARRLARALPQRPGRRPLVSARARARRAARARGRRGRRGRGGRPARALRLRALRRLAGAPADADRQRDRRRCRVVRDGRVGCATTNRHRRRGPRARLARARRRGGGQRARDPDFPGLAAARRAVPAVDGYDEETAALGADDQARLAAEAIAAAPELGLYGYFTSGVTEIAVASTTGLARRAGDDRRDRARARRRRRRVGLRRAHARGGAATLDPAAVAPGGGREGGAARAARGARAGPLPGRARAVRVRRAALLLRLRRLQRRSRCSRSAATSPAGSASSSSTSASRSPTTRSTRAGCPKAFDFEGVPKQPRRRSSRTASRATSSGTARTRRARRATAHVSTGHAPPRLARGTTGPIPFKLSVVPAARPTRSDELAELVGDGIYVTRLHYLSVVDPREGIITGMTRDGTFRIRGGKVAEPLVNLRFTVSVPELLADAAGPHARGGAVNQSDFYDERYPIGRSSRRSRPARFNVTGRRLEARSVTAGVVDRAERRPRASRAGAARRAGRRRRGRAGRRAFARPYSRQRRELRVRRGEAHELRVVAANVRAEAEVAPGRDEQVRAVCERRVGAGREADGTLGQRGNPLLRVAQRDRGLRGARLAAVAEILGRRRLELRHERLVVGAIRGVVVDPAQLARNRRVEDDGIGREQPPDAQRGARAAGRASTARMSPSGTGASSSFPAWKSCSARKGSALRSSTRIALALRHDSRRAGRDQAKWPGHAGWCRPRLGQAVRNVLLGVRAA